MNAYFFIENFGADKANTIIENVVYGAEYYSEKTGNYYATNENDSVKIKDLKKALQEYNELLALENEYLTKLEQWKISVNKGVKVWMY